MLAMMASMSSSCRLSSRHESLAACKSRSRPSVGGADEPGAALFDRTRLYVRNAVSKGEFVALIDDAYLLRARLRHKVI